MAEELHDCVVEVANENEQKTCTGTRISKQNTTNLALNTNLPAHETPNLSFNIDTNNAAIAVSQTNAPATNATMHDDTVIKKTEGPSNKQQLLLQDLNITPLNADVSAGTPYKPLAIQSAAGKTCRFPKLEECAHFHYERVQLGALSVCLVNERAEQQSVNGGDSSNAPASLQSVSLNNIWFLIKVTTQQTENFLIKRSFDNMKLLDEMLHRCVYDRKISGLLNLKDVEFTNEQEIEYLVANYLERFSKIASDSITCGTILTWLQLDNKGRRLPLADDDTMRSINTPAVGAAYGVRRYQAQAQDEISIELGDMISVIDMPTPAESVWWRGKKSNWQKSYYEVGFFPQSCVATIGDKVPRYFPLPAPLVAQVDVSPTKPVLRKHGKLIAFFRSFILSRPSRRRLKQSGIYRERVFSCDLSEHLLNSAQEIPLVLKYCAEFIEAHGIVDGIYRLSGITSTIQRLRQAFDEERVPDLGNPEMRQDIHAVSSLLKMYFRELPNPLCTYQLYDNFVAAVQVKSDDKERLRLMKETVIKLPPPHYRTLRYLARHLYRISQYAERTGMTDKNLAIVWAPNLLRSPALEAGGVAALRGVGVQAVVTEFLIRNSQQIFNDIETPQPQVTPTSLSVAEMRLDSLTDCESLLVKQREFDQNVLVQERPKSINVCGAKLISLEEAQERHSQKEVGENVGKPASMPISLPNNMASYIEVGGGPASLPDKYHTVLSVPRSWQKRKTHSWKSIFTRNQRPVSHNLSQSQKSSTSAEHHNKNKLMSHQISKPQIQIVEGKLFKEQKTKSVEFFDTNKANAESGHVGFGKGSDICLRSNSIDSLRTAGHSRSVSHDSYFDLLQSPLHQLNNTSPSRELTELELNFDREEPEMRIFSESESLVSSPRVGKENLPPNYASFNARRIIRARPEEFFSQTNSINPSPKKQPRLNLLLSPKTMPSSVETKIEPTENNLLQNNEHFSKRYKFEDQFPDIQYIDCSTPEHTISSSNSGTHKMSKVNETTTTTATTNDLANIQKRITTNGNNNYSRYSYPSLQLGGKRQDNEIYKERFSYPVSMEKTQLQSMKMPKNLTVMTENSLKVGTGLSRSAHRNSYCGNNEDKNGRLFLRSNSTDCSTKPFEDAELLQANSKISMTPSSTAHSPHYTLLGGDTSSENSSTPNTPQFEVVDGLASAPILQNLNNSNTIHESEDSLEYEEIAVKSQLTQMMDKKALRNELSLDLTPFINKTTNMTNTRTMDYSNLPQEEQRKQNEFQQNQQQIPQLLLLSPNSSILTDNTSASVTPSEFGYQALQRQSSTNSLLDMDDEAAAAILNKDSPMSTQSLLSPIQKSTISITYNLRSEKKPKDNKIVPIETKFDENAVYEQVKLFRNSVSELNEIFHCKPQQQQQQQQKSINIKDKQIEEEAEIIENEGKMKKLQTTMEANMKDNTKALTKHEFEKKFYFSHMNENDNDDDNDDDIEGQSNNIDCHNKQLLYENVQLRKPHNVYANVLVTTTGSTTKTTPTTTGITKNDSKKKTDLKSEINKLSKGQNMNKNNNNDKNINNINNNNNHNKKNNRNNQINFSVKELANKFESTKTTTNEQQQQQHHDIHKKITLTNKEKIEENNEKDRNLMKNSKLKNGKQITRSLDEAAFQREFNAKQRNTELTSGSVMQLQDELSDLVTQRRKSFDFTRPKTLNQPKRLPGMSIAAANRTILEQSMENESNRTVDEMEEYEQQSPEILITPTTEAAALDFSNPNLLSGVKLDRERINRIKEERRQQLTAKYGLKSRSKTELNTDLNFNKDILKARSKSRGDISDFELDRDDNYLSTSDMNLQQCKRIDETNQIRLSQNRKSISLCQKQQQQQQLQNTDKNTNTEVDVKHTTSNSTAYSNDRKQRESITNKEYPIKRNILKADDNIKQKYAINELTTTKPRIHASSSSLNNEKSLILTTNKTKSNCEQISPQFSIRDVTAMFESRSQSQH